MSQIDRTGKPKRTVLVRSARACVRRMADWHVLDPDHGFRVVATLEYLPGQDNASRLQSSIEQHEAVRRYELDS